MLDARPSHGYDPASVEPVHEGERARDKGMEGDIRLDCVGMRCPRPIIEIAKAARRNPPGSVLEVLADDLAFESDVRAWCETTGATLLDLGSKEGVWTARIRLGSGKGHPGA